MRIYRVCFMALLLAIGFMMGCDNTCDTCDNCSPDTTRPTVISTIPVDLASGVAVNGNISAIFSEEMEPATITTSTFTVVATAPEASLTQGAAAVPGVVTYEGTVATLNPTSNLAPNTEYTATVTTGAEDLAGNGLAVNKTWTFTTGALPDLTAPTVISTIPAHLATGVALNGNVTAVFSEAMAPATITALGTFTLKQGTTTIPGVVTYVGTTATFNPTNNLAVSTVYTAKITTSAEDAAGNALAADKIWTFTTGTALDTTRPTVILVFPADDAIDVPRNTVVTATFSEPMDPLTVTATGSFTVAGVTGSVLYDAVSKVATFTPASNLAASTLYTATVTTAVKDLAGNALLVNKVWSFTTGTRLAQGAVPLLSAATFGIMATSAITSTGNSVVNGDVSLDPGTSMTGFPPGIVNGSIHINDLVSAQARIDPYAAYEYAKGLPPGTTITGGADLGALYPSGIPPGTYTSGSTMLVSTSLVLDAGGNANAVWVFQIGSSLTTTASVTLAHGAQAKNVFWVPTESATIGVGTIFHGTIVAGISVTGVTGSVINGRILAGATTAGTVALQNTTVNVPAQ